MGKTHKTILKKRKPVMSYKKMIKSMQMKPSICTSVTGDNAKDFLSTVKKAVKNGSDFAELRIDCLKNQKPDNINKIILESALPLIVTNRNKENHGKFPSGNEESRLSLLYSSIEAQPAFIDIELYAEQEDRIKVIDAAKNNGVGVICSYHNFQDTPSTEEIVKNYKEICKTDADLAKLVYTPHTKQDVVNILNAVSAMRSFETPFTIFGMGDVGQDTRILSPILGSCLTYCSVNPDPKNGLSQISVKETKKIFDLMESKKKDWSSIRQEHKELLALAIGEYMSKESYPFIGKLIDA